MNPLLNEDIFIHICQKFGVRAIINLEEISKWHKEMIRKNKWTNLSVKNFLANNYKRI